MSKLIEPNSPFFWELEENYTWQFYQMKAAGCLVCVFFFKVVAQLNLPKLDEASFIVSVKELI